MEEALFIPQFKVTKEKARVYNLELTSENTDPARALGIIDFMYNVTEHASYGTQEDVRGHIEWQTTTEYTSNGQAQETPSVSSKVRLTLKPRKAVQNLASLLD